MSSNKQIDGEGNLTTIYKGTELDREQLSAFADTFAKAFCGYPLFQFFLNYKDTPKRVLPLWDVSLKAVLNSASFITSGEDMLSVAVWLPNKNSNISVWQYMKAGGIKMLLRMGIPAVARMLRFEKFATEIKNKYATPNCQYLYGFATMPEARGKGYGTLLLQAIARSLDENQQDCYLETAVPINVEIYRKYGFVLKETVKFPNSNLTLFAMFRPHKEISEENR